MIVNASYPIFIGEQALYQLNQWIQATEYSEIWVLVDENTGQHCWPLVEKALYCKARLIQIPSGEAHKNLATCQQIWQALFEGQCDRKALLLNLGGGVIGDMGGFCAATYKRGIDFVQVPTTLLSQVDASVGGKLGIDFAQVKNGVGLFQNPQAVFIHPSFLTTLAERELYSGFAEVIKHALIADARHWEKIIELQSLDEITNWSTIIEHSVQIKHSVVAKDYQETGLRKILNFGHTIGHAIESLSWETERPLLHGEAIAIGMICEAYLSNKVRELSAEALKNISNFITRLYGRYDLSLLDWDEVIALMYQDKKNIYDYISFSLLASIGQGLYNQQASEELILESLNYYFNG